ncbi:hypothetical protein AB0H36_47780 [Kribbella sp. NPDC050820]|uniref:hypothetical protein n=1 Tax=Kribbella sp. NPDC050820 TaxID=3155408 RepID=UPI0034029A76
MHDLGLSGQRPDPLALKYGQDDGRQRGSESERKALVRELRKQQRKAEKLRNAERGRQQREDPEVSAPNRSRALMQLGLSIVVTVVALILVFGDETQQSTGAGLLGIVLGYWLR